jgi:hypothetical protein
MLASGHQPPPPEKGPGDPEFENTKTRDYQTNSQIENNVPEVLGMKGVQLRFSEYCFFFDMCCWFSRFLFHWEFPKESWKFFFGVSL